jgi:hypothetical protein
MNFHLLSEPSTQFLKLNQLFQKLQIVNTLNPASLVSSDGVISGNQSEFNLDGSVLRGLVIVVDDDKTILSSNNTVKVFFPGFPSGINSVAHAGK